MQNIKAENKPHCFTCQNTVKNTCLGDAWKKNVGPLQAEHTCSGICHESVMGVWSSADYNLVPLYYECLDVAWSLVVATGIA